MPLLLKFLMLGCFQPHRYSYGESRISYPFQNSADLTGFRISGLFSLDSIMYEGMELVVNQEHQTLYVPRC